jgi:hypothetical protein
VTGQQAAGNGLAAAALTDRKRDGGAAYNNGKQACNRPTHGRRGEHNFAERLPLPVRQRLASKQFQDVLHDMA